MSKVLVLAILLFALYTVLYKLPQEQFVPEDPDRAIEPPWTRRRARTRSAVQKSSVPADETPFSSFVPHEHVQNYLLPQVTFVANTKADRLNALRQDLHATGQVDNSREHNLRYVHDNLLEPEVEFDAGRPTGQLKIRSPAYTPDWARFEGQNSTLHVLNYERYEDSSRADADGIAPFDSAEQMQAALP